MESQASVSSSSSDPSPKGGKRIPLFKRIVFYVIMICLPLVLVETLVRSYFAFRVGPDVLLYGTPFSKHQEEFDPKGTIQRKAKKTTTVAFHEMDVGGYAKYYPHQKRNDQDEDGNPIDVMINGRGFRGRDFEVVKPPGVIRVVTLGASSTFGFKNHDDQTYPSLMEAMLNRAVPELNAALKESSSEPIERIEVLNLGIPHLRTEQIYSLFLNEGLEFQPDYVTFYEGVNDAAWLSPPETSTEKTKETIKSLPLANQVFRELRYRLLTVALVGTLISEKAQPYASKEDYQALRAGKPAYFISSLQGIFEACREHGMRLIVGNQQATGREGRGEKRSAIHGLSYEEECAKITEKMRAVGRVFTVEAFLMVHKELMDAQKQWAISNGIPYVDVIGAMDSNRDYLVSWVHLNADGNRVVAEAFSEAILKDLKRSEPRNP